MKKGEVTVYLSLIFILLLSFIGSIIESASIQVSKNYKRGDMDRAMESVFAEYQIELLKEYDIFALEGTYETGQFSYDNIWDRIVYYGGAEASREMNGIRLLTDNNAQAFQEQILAYMEHKLGITELNKLTGNSADWTWQEDQIDDYQSEDATVQEQMNESLAEAEEALPEEENPLVNISNIKQSSLLNIVVSNPEQLSQKQIDLSSVPSGRTMQKGHGTFSTRITNQVLTKAAIGEYVLEQFEHYLVAEETNSILYQIEYLLGGKASDMENLKYVVNRIIMLRFVTNYAYILTDAQKQAEASALALSLCTLLTVPGIAEMVKHSILLGWAYGESIMDARSLLNGKKVAIVKNAENWQLSLSGLLTLGTAEDTKEGADTEGGLDYQGYLRILLFTTDQDTLAMRALDMIELNLRLNQDLTFFRADNCISAMTIKSQYSLRRGIQYEFGTNFGYQ